MFISASSVGVRVLIIISVFTRSMCPFTSVSSFFSSVLFSFPAVVPGSGEDSAVTLRLLFRTTIKRALIMPWNVTFHSTKTRAILICIFVRF